MKWTSAFCSTCIFLCATLSTSQGQEAARALRQADSLFAGGIYFHASIEYERAYYLSEGPGDRILANLGKASALKQMGLFDKAHVDLQRSLPQAPSDSLRFALLNELALCAYLSGDYQTARSWLQQIIHFYGDNPWSDCILLLEALTLLQLEQWEALAGHLEQRAAAGDGEAGLLADALRDTIREGAVPVRKDPRRARRLSTFLPGTGHVWAGYPGRGLLNAGAQLGALASFAWFACNGFYVAGVSVGLALFQSFYFGGIRQAGDLAAGGSEARMEAFKRDLAARLFALEKQAPAHD
jgi:tetratricopeptide (TPR) repeat protein